MKKFDRRIFTAISVLGLLGSFAIGGCKSSPAASHQDAETTKPPAPGASEQQSDPTDNETIATPIAAKPLPAEASDPALKIATFAAGCFWCIEPPFDKTEGVVKTIVGYTGGPEKAPTYEQVSYGRTGHAEAVRVYFDPSKVTYDELLTVFWHNINPTQKNGQFVDVGAQYRSAIFYHDAEQKRLAEASKKELRESAKFDTPIVTEIEPAEAFWKAEEYHQDFYKKSPVRYKSYRSGSGRDEYIKRVWGE